MTSLSWHAPPQLLARFVDEPAALDDATAASIDAHLMACAECRQAVAGLTDAGTLAATWAEVADRVDRPRPTTVERLLLRLGQREGMARLVAATPSLAVAWFGAVLAIAAAAVAVSRTTGADGPFLVLAPLVPLAAVASTFAVASDPTGEAGVATPLYGVALALRRALTVLTPTFALLGMMAIALPEVSGAALWVLPAIALVLAALALATWWHAERAVGVLAAAWVVTVTTARWLDGPTVAFADSVAFSAPGQAAAALVAVAAAAVLAARHDRYATMEVPR
jgi:hypothetical protein